MEPVVIKKEMGTGKTAYAKLQAIWAKILKRNKKYAGETVVMTLTTFNNWLNTQYITWETLLWFIGKNKMVTVDNKNKVLLVKI